jgi:hypothetical protein
MILLQKILQKDLYKINIPKAYRKEEMTNESLHTYDDSDATFHIRIEKLRKDEQEKITLKNDQ